MPCQDCAEYHRAYGRLPECGLTENYSIDTCPKIPRLTSRNALLWDMYCMISNQHIVSFGGIVDLNLTAVYPIIDMYGEFLDEFEITPLAALKSLKYIYDKFRNMRDLKEQGKNFQSNLSKLFENKSEGMRERNASKNR